MKTWRDEIKKHIDNWSRRLGSRGWWPKYVYHSTDIRNAVRIIQCEYLYSRNEAIKRNLMQVDNASSEIIEHTKKEHQNLVRLYFRPRTPTEYCREGIRPIGQRKYNAHCPIPIYFLFDALSILSKDETEFSSGNLASDRAEHESSLQFFLSIPFDLVFHHGRILAEEDKDEIIFRRNAEVLVPNSLRLNNALKAVVCRSQAERQTLINLLDRKIRNKWIDRIKLESERGPIFERKWTFIEDVTVVNDRVYFWFNPDTTTPGPFYVKFSYKDVNKNTSNKWEGRLDSLDSRLFVRVKDGYKGIATLTLDDSLAFSAPVTFEDIPF